MDAKSNIVIRTITAAETLPLRMSVLRPNRPVEVAQFPDDNAPTSRHFGAMQGQDVVGIASLFVAELAERPGVAAIQLRGMATAPAVRGMGYGCALVRACEAHTREQGIGLIWCNARVCALEFYRKLGWEIIGGQFEIPDVGPHFHMWRNV